MSVLVDTNVLLRGTQVDHVTRGLALDAIGQLWREGEVVAVVPEVHERVAEILDVFEFLGEPPGLFSEWQRLVVRSDVSGRPAHDTRLVAAMMLHDIPRLLTFNKAHFRRYAGITAIAADDLIAAPRQ
jgi:hypothetical protein